MRVCILIHSIDKKDGGPSRSVPILARGLSQVGLDVTLMAVKSEDMNLHAVEGVGIKTIIIDKNISKSELQKLLVDGHFDLIHFQMIWIPIYHYAAQICRKHHIPYMITPRGTLEPWCYNDKNIAKRIKKKVAMAVYQFNDIQKASAILATAKMEADNLRKIGFTNPISVVANGIDVSEYKCRTEDDKTSVKKQILFLSRVHPKKGIEYLIDAWQTLHAKFQDWNVVIAGNGEESYIQQLNGLITQKGLQNCVTIVPPVFGEEKHKLYCESSLFVLPTHSENFGMVIAEAMSCGVPVITTNGTPWQELNELDLGWCIDLSLENLVEALTEALELGTDVLFEKGQKCSKHVYDTYQYTQVAAKNKLTYEWILGKGEKPEHVI